MRKFQNQILCGDCIELLSGVSEPFADLIFADPPFNIGYRYDKYHDKVEKNNYIAWTRDWMAVCLNALKPHGSFYIAIAVAYTHLRAHETEAEIVCRLLLEKKKENKRISIT